MALFHSRKTSQHSAQAEAIAAFWTWWDNVGAIQSAAAIADRDQDRMVPGLTKKVTTIASGLAWEFASGTESQHVLVVSAAGNPELRAVARRWRRAAPAADELWAYSDARPPAKDAAATVLRINNVEIPVARASVLARVSGAQVDMSVYHPAFANIPEEGRVQATFMLLDLILGEAAVETWVGGIGTTTEPPLDGVPLTGMTAVIRDLSDRFTNDSGEPNWVLMEGTTPDGERVLASAQVPLRAASAPHLDTHVGVRVTFSDLTPDGLPGEQSLAALRALEDHLIKRLDGSGRIVAHETHQGERIWHAYVDSTTPAAEQVKTAVGGWDQGSVDVESADDPGWLQVQHLRG